MKVWIHLAQYRDHWLGFVNMVDSDGQYEVYWLF
jgi:hypothetical protein